MPARAPQLLLFDLDGTLVDSIELILASFRHAFGTHLGTCPTDAELVAGIGTPLLAQILEVVPDETRAAAVMATYRSFQMQHHDAMLREFNGTRETLALLRERGHPMAVVTSKMSELAHRALRHTHLDAYVDVVVGHDMCTRHKPDPEPVEIALRLLDRPAANAMFIGDSPHDIASGNAAGVTTVAALWGPFPRHALEREQPDFLLETIDGLVELAAAHQR